MNCVRDLMTNDPEIVRPSMLLTELERSLLAGHIGACPVVEDGRLVGLVSRSDVVRALALERSFDEQLEAGFEGGGESAPDSERQSVEAEARIGARLAGRRVGDVMIHDVITVAPEQGIVEAAQTLLQHKIHHMPVVEQGTVVGIVSSLDLVGLIAREIYAKSS